MTNRRVIYSYYLLLGGTVCIIKITCGQPEGALTSTIRLMKRPHSRYATSGKRIVAVQCRTADHMDGNEGARVLARLRSGDGPLSVRVRPSSLKRDCDRRATSTGKSACSTYTRSHA
jgi:hypothetical protein